VRILADAELEMIPTHSPYASSWFKSTKFLIAAAITCLGLQGRECQGLPGPGSSGWKPEPLSHASTVRIPQFTARRPDQLLRLIPPGSWDTPRFKKIILDSRFVSEGVAVADVNRDKKLDILAGNVWYQAPNWTPHEIAPYQPIDPAKGYSNCFSSWASDVNRDGWSDQIVIGMPGEKAIWRENPKGKEIPWAEHPIWRSACNESPLFVDLFRNGKPVLVMGYDDNYLAWFEPNSDPAKEWLCHNISDLKGSGSQRYSHGLVTGSASETSTVTAATMCSPRMATT
jgi:hypothetical protein